MEALDMGQPNVHVRGKAQRAPDPAELRLVGNKGISGIIGQIERMKKRCGAVPGWDSYPWRTGMKASYIDHWSDIFGCNWAVSGGRMPKSRSPKSRDHRWR
jgi:hypothetical protein